MHKEQKYKVKSIRLHRVSFNTTEMLLLQYEQCPHLRPKRHTFLCFVPKYCLVKITSMGPMSRKPEYCFFPMKRLQLRQENKKEKHQCARERVRLRRAYMTSSLTRGILGFVVHTVLIASGGWQTYWCYHHHLDGSMNWKYLIYESNRNHIKT